MTNLGSPVADVASVLIRERGRLREIAAVFSKYGLTRLANRALDAEEDPEGRPTDHFTATMADPDVGRWTTGERVRGALSELGTTWIKFGQMLSVRPDVVGQDVADELTKLQSDVPADAAPYAATRVESSLGRPIGELYASFEPEPMASGSVAQVHRATLHDGAEVVVKVLHEGVERKVTSDLELMRALAAFMEQADAEIARHRPSVLVAEFDALMRSAIDLGDELANLKRFAENFAAEPDVVIPGVHAQLSGPAVLTMELMVGDPLTDAATVERLGWTVEELVNRTTEIYLEMIFRDGSFHADPHPGNFLLRAEKQIVILDFGDVGYLSQRRREQLESLLLAMTKGDLDDLTDAIVDITDAPPDTDLARLSADTDRWSSQYLTSDVADLDMTAMMSSGMQLMHNHGLNMPADLSTLFRVLLLLQGMGARLGATNDLGELMRPYVEDMARKRFDPSVLGRRALKTARGWNDLLRVLPDDITALLGQVKDGQLDIDFQLHDPDGRVENIVDGMIVAALVVASGQLLSRQTKPLAGGLSVPGLAAVSVGVLTYRRLRGKRSDYVTVTSRLSRMVKFGAGRRPSTTGE